jgi:hypothetical protein
MQTAPGFVNELESSAFFDEMNRNMEIARARRERTQSINDTDEMDWHKHEGARCHFDRRRNLP